MRRLRPFRCCPAPVWPQVFFVSPARLLTTCWPRSGSGAVAALAVHPSGHRLPGVPMTLDHGRVHGRAVAVPGLPRAELIVTLAASADGPVAAVVRVGDGVTVHDAESKT